MQTICRRAAVRFGSIVVFGRELNESSSGLAAALGLQAREGTPADVGLLISEGEPPPSAEAVLARFRRGDRCFLATDSQERLAYSTWIARGTAHVPELGMDLIFGPCECYGYDVFTRKDLRGKGIDRVMRCFAHDTLAAEGFERIYGYVRGENFRGLRAARRLHVRVGKLRYLSVGSCRPWVVGGRALGLTLRRRGGEGSTSSRPLVSDPRPDPASVAVLGDPRSWQ
jgi:GNAT superfamily N-acetyltransferase